MNILIVTDSPFADSAYAIQSVMLAKALISAGHGATIYGMTFGGSPTTHEGIRIVGNLGLLHGAALSAEYYVQSLGADMVITFKDPVLFNVDAIKRMSVPVVMLAPVDTEPPNLALLNAVSPAARVIALTRYSQTALKQQGVLSSYAPHAVDTEFFSPAASTWRQDHHVSNDAFLAVFVGINNDMPSRKNLDQIVLAWHQWVNQHPDRDIVLYLHTEAANIAGGHHIAYMLDALGIPERNIILPDPHRYTAGDHDAAYMRDVYRAADVLLMLGNEGFGVPIIEAAACGTPAVALEFSGLRETMLGGWLIKADPPRSGQLQWHPSGGFRFRVSPEAIIEALEAAYHGRNNQSLKEGIRRRAVERYGLKTVMNEYWLPLIAELELQFKEAVLE